jgi:Mg-chelatase subunit ChlI
MKNNRGNPATSNWPTRRTLFLVEERIAESSGWIQAVKEEMGQVLVGQERLVDRLLIGLLCNGHILLEGVPGLAKTLAVKALSGSLPPRSPASSSPRTCCPPTSSAP